MVAAVGRGTQGNLGACLSTCGRCAGAAVAIVLDGDIIGDGRIRLFNCYGAVCGVSAVRCSNGDGRSTLADSHHNATIDRHDRGIGGRPGNRLVSRIFRLNCSRQSCSAADLHVQRGRGQCNTGNIDRDRVHSHDAACSLIAVNRSNSDRSGASADTRHNAVVDRRNIGIRGRPGNIFVVRIGGGYSRSQGLSSADQHGGFRLVQRNAGDVDRRGVDGERSRCGLACPRYVIVIIIRSQTQILYANCILAGSRIIRNMNNNFGKDSCYGIID
ncbi:hypothetical protein SRB521_01448 [Intestinimonas butyriciproducens]|nr:hypothetical protein SRB521_01448 [Intestinimonas butyriciproducens]